jgi:MFS family permease
MGVLFGPVGAVLPELFPTHLRYTGASVAYSMGGILGGSLAPYIAQLLVARGGIGWVGAYLAAASLVSLAAVWSMGETQGGDLAWNKEAAGLTPVPRQPEKVHSAHSETASGPVQL